MAHELSGGTRRWIAASLTACLWTGFAGFAGSHTGDHGQDDLSRVARAVEAETNCRLLSWLIGREASCRTPIDLSDAERTLADDLVGLVQGFPTPGAAGGPPSWREWRSIRCQSAIADHVVAAVREAGSDPGRRRGGQMIRTVHRRPVADSRAIERACRPIRLSAWPSGVLPSIGPQCAAAVDRDTARVDVESLTRCLDTLVETWVARSTGRATRRRPNVIVILADDQRADAVGAEHPRDRAGSVPAMPAVVDRLVRSGVSFPHAFASSPVCGPSRAALLTGQYANRNGLFDNEGLLGGRFFRDHDTLALWMKDGGYRTGFFGKYMNEYPLRWAPPRRPPIVPAGWDDWRVFNHAESIPHSGFSMVENGSVVWYGASDYSTDVLREQSFAFIDGVAGDERPFFLWISTATPHYPWTPAPRHRGAFAASPPHAPPSLFEPDVSDKPAWVASLVGDSLPRRLQMEQLRRSQLEMQLSVDELVAALMERLDALGITDDTAIIYTSDNGHAWGEHRWLSKGCAWEECARVPLIVRYPPLAPLARIDDSLVSLVDIAVTVADLGDVVPPPDRDGRSLRRILDATEREPRTDVLIESHIAPTRRWVTLREQQFKLVVYENGELELYDLAEDPHELRNLAAVVDQQARLADMRARVDARWTGWKP